MVSDIPAHKRNGHAIPLSGSGGHVAIVRDKRCVDIFAQPAGIVCFILHRTDGKHLFRAVFYSRVLRLAKIIGHNTAVFYRVNLFCQGDGSE